MNIYDRAVSLVWRGLDTVARVLPGTPGTDTQVTDVARQFVEADVESERLDAVKEVLDDVERQLEYSGPAFRDVPYKDGMSEAIRIVRKVRERWLGE